MSEDIRQDPLPPPRAETPGAAPDYPPLEYPEETPYPWTVMTAGVIWIVVGCLILLNLIVTLVQAAATAGMDGRVDGTRLSGGVCSLIFIGLIGYVFLMAGAQSVRGTSRGTLGNGIGSLLFGLLEVGAAAVLGTLGQGAGAGLQGLVAMLLLVLIGTMLLAAGILALAGGSRYKLWQEAHKLRRRRATTDGEAARLFRG